MRRSLASDIDPTIGWTSGGVAVRQARVSFPAGNESPPPVSGFHELWRDEPFGKTVGGRWSSAATTRALDTLTVEMCQPFQLLVA